ncbi:MAG: Blp family class II bacteriocin [Clostridia bacterium]|nr:Blp family class II bacteriocin [Clostridia bacterium]
MNTNIKALSMEELENISGGIKAKTVKKIVAGAAAGVFAVSYIVIAAVGYYKLRNGINEIFGR